MKTVTTALLLVTLLTPLRALHAQENLAPSVNLHVAAFQGNIDALRQHLNADADLNEKDAYGSTPLIIATTFGKPDVAGLLIEAGADLEIRNNNGATPLHIAAFLCRTEIVGLLLENGADRHLRDNEGNTAFDAVAAPFEDVIGMYDGLGQALAPLGFVLDYEHIRTTRSKIAEMLRPGAEELEEVEYRPLPGRDWEVSTPAAEGLDPMLVAELYLDANALSNIYGLLVIKNGRLIAEGYFNEGAIERKNILQSVTKSYVSALVGIALDRGCLSSVDQKMMEFFPEFADQLDDPRKEKITIRDLLQMRAGYPWEVREPPYLDTLVYSDNWRWLPHLVDFPLTHDPGTEFGYSNLTSHLLGVIVARACNSDLASFGQEHLFSPIGAEVGDWSRDADDHNYGNAGISFTARDMAKFGLLYLRDGEYEGNQVLSADWVEHSLRRYSEGMYDNKWRNEASNHYMNSYFRDVGYGYQWWSARVGDHRFDFAWGYGGNFIILLEELDLIVVTAADPLLGLRGREEWMLEREVFNLVGKFMKSVPTE